MKLNLALFSLIMFCAGSVQAAETQTLAQSGIDTPAQFSDGQAQEDIKPFIIDVSWKNYMDASSTTNLSDVEPSSGFRSEGNAEEGFTLSLIDPSPAKQAPTKLELSYNTRRNFSMRTKHSGLLITKKFKFEPQCEADTMPDNGADIGRPSFKE